MDPNGWLVLAMEHWQQGQPADEALKEALAAGVEATKAREAAIASAQLSLGQALLLAGLEQQGLQLHAEGLQLAGAIGTGWEPWEVVRKHAGEAIAMGEKELAQAMASHWVEMSSCEQPVGVDDLLWSQLLVNARCSEGERQQRDQALENAKIHEAAGEDEQAIKELAPWANVFQGQGIVGLQILRMASLQRAGREQEKEAALVAFQEKHPFYPIRQMVDGAVAWKTNDWWTVVLSYAEAMVQLSELEVLWPRIKHGLTMLRQQNMNAEAETAERLKQLLTKAAQPTFTDTRIALLLEAIPLLPVATQYAEPRFKALVRASELLSK